MSIHGLCPECGLSRDLSEDYDKVRSDLDGCETDYTNMRKDNDRLRAENAELREAMRLCSTRIVDIGEIGRAILAKTAKEGA